jgi:hypothetical protein
VLLLDVLLPSVLPQSPVAAVWAVL